MHQIEGLRMEPVYIFVTVAVSLALLFGLRLLQSPLDEREPPLIPPRIPVLGHALGLLQNGVSYYATAT